MILTGQQRGILKEGILGAYPNEDELIILLSEKMDLSYSAIARGNEYTSRVAYLVKKLEADGAVERLIRVVVEKGIAESRYESRRNRHIPKLKIVNK